MRQLFGYPGARRYLLGQSVSLFGDMSLWLAMGIWVKTLTGSSGAAGLTFFFFALPQLAAPLAGVLVDRLPRRRMLVWTNLAVAALVLALLAVHDAGDVWLIYVVMFGYGASYTVLGSGGSALLRVLLPERLLGDANAYLRTVQEGLRLIGPITGAALFTIVGGGILAIVDAATFLIAAGALWSVRVDELPAAPRDEPWLNHTLAGVRHLWRTIVLRQLTIAIGAAFFFVGVIESVAFAIVSEGLHRPSAFLGPLVAIQGVGAVASGLTAGALMRRIGEGPTAAAGLGSFAGGTLLLTTTSLGTVLAGMIMIGFSLPWAIVGYNTALQLHAPLALQGRVSSASDLLAGTPQIASIAIGAALVSVVPYQLLLAVIAFAITSCALYLVSRPQQHHNHEPADTFDPPDPPATSPRPPARGAQSSTSTGVR
jgi:hypothetical protein